ncbi:response regulator [bacterium]|nr:response regulator [bacterium]
MKTPSQLTKELRRAAVPFLPAAWLGRLPVKKTVLLAEHDQSSRAFTALVLRGLGHEVLDAVDGPEALQVARGREESGQGIDLLFTDLMMPAMGGKELAERLWRIVPLDRVVFVSELPPPMARRHWRLDDRITVLQRPFSAQTLTQAARRLLEVPSAIRA